MHLQGQLQVQMMTIFSNIIRTLCPNNWRTNIRADFVFALFVFRIKIPYMLKEIKPTITIVVMQEFNRILSLK